VDEVFLLTGMSYSVTGCFISDVSILQCCMCTEVFFFIYFMFSFIRGVDVTDVSCAVWVSENVAIWAYYLSLLTKCPVGSYTFLELVIEGGFLMPIK
jgi:hypothetical protein